MNNSIPRRLLALAAASALVLAACGDDDESDPTDAGGGTTAEPSDTTIGSDDPMARHHDCRAGGTTMGGETTMGPDTTMGGDTTTPGSTGGTVALEGGSVSVSGSSTVEPISVRVGELALEESGGDLQATVEGPGTGDGFELFCGGETDISDASRPIDEEEIAACEEAGVEYVELEVAIDGLTVLTNPDNADVTCLDVPALYALLGPESEGVTEWSAASELAGTVGSEYVDQLPEAPLDIFGPGQESGTYDTMVEFLGDPIEAQEQEETLRADYTSSARDAEIVAGIEGSSSSLGWVGYALFVGEGDALKAIEIDGGDGCVGPTEETIADGSYSFSRSLFIYVNTAKAEENPAVASYVDLYLSDAGLATVSDAGYVDLPADRIEATRQAWADR
ncbi:MAG: substrate-binding domain-containing protein [Ilumatobacteraceae bacterium]